MSVNFTNALKMVKEQRYVHWISFAIGLAFFFVGVFNPLKIVYFQVRLMLILFSMPFFGSIIKNRWIRLVIAIIYLLFMLKILNLL